MVTVMNAFEVFEIAEQIERNGGKFYRRAAEIVKKDSSKEFMLRLAAMEDKHEEYFHALKNKYNLESGNVLPDIDGQALSYIRTMAEGKIFGNINDISQRINSESSYNELLEKAIQFEKDTIVYFASVKDMIKDDLGKEKIDSLIREEVSHVSMLLNESIKNNI